MNSIVPIILIFLCSSAFATSVSRAIPVEDLTAETLSENGICLQVKKALSEKGGTPYSTFYIVAVSFPEKILDFSFKEIESRIRRKDNYDTTVTFSPEVSEGRLAIKLTLTAEELPNASLLASYSNYVYGLKRFRIQLPDFSSSHNTEEYPNLRGITFLCKSRH